MARAIGTVALGVLATVGLRAVPARAADVPATDVTATGVHASLMRVRGGDRDAQVGAVGISTSHVGFGFESPFTVRVVNTGSLAGGHHGVQGSFANAVAGGLRVPFDKTHGVVVRGGIEGSIFGNKFLWDSLIELPQFHLGYQWLVPGSVVDVTAKTGYVLEGRFNTGDAGKRRLDGAPEIGGIGALHIAGIDVRASYSHIIPRHGGAPVNLFEAAFCGHASVIVLCSDTRYEVGDVRVPPDDAYRSAQVSYVGLTFGVVLFEKKARK
jgi:hypothetical protein